MQKILFIKQRIRRGPAIESDIEDVIEQSFGALQEIDFDCFELGEELRKAEDRTRGAAPRDVAIARKTATEKCLRYVKDQGHGNIFLLNGYLVNHFNPEFFPALRRITDRIAAWQLDDPYYVDLILPFLPYLHTVFTVDTITLPLYKRHGKITEWLPMACSPKTHKPLNDIDARYKSDVCFIGVPFKGSRRVRIVDDIAQQLAGYQSRIIGATANDRWQQELTRYDLLKHQVLDKFVATDEAVRYYNGAAINLNLHKDSFGHMWDHNTHHLQAASPCERTFSIAGCNAFQLIDASRPDLAKLFKPGEEIISFEDSKDLSAKIDYYLAHADERREIAEKTWEIVCQKHTYMHRAEYIAGTAFS